MYYAESRAILNSTSGVAMRALASALRNIQ
jgi:hypothetical protein